MFHSSKKANLHKHTHRHCSWLFTWAMLMPLCATACNEFNKQKEIKNGVILTSSFLICTFTVPYFWELQHTSVLRRGWGAGHSEKNKEWEVKEWREKNKSLGVSSQQHVKLLSRLICTHKRARKQLSTVTHLRYVISVDMHWQPMHTPQHPGGKIMKHNN